ncbi:MAG: LuxR C-terminal-related transcriptional regulator [Pseudolabrys sp.]|jgi:DNA-binding CsgD family transcriptional regulator
MADLQQSLNALEACQAVDEVRSVFQGIIENYGFSSFGFVDASKPWENDPLLVTTHNQEWIDTYRSENFLATDPCLDVAKRTNLPFNWGSIKLPPVNGKRKPGAVRTMEAVHDFGILEGLTVPVHYCDQLGRRYSSVCALFWKDKLTAFFANLKFNRVQMHMIILYMMQRLVELHALEKSVSPRFNRNDEADPIWNLTDREKEVLKWAALGKTADETADILVCSRKTVEAHIQNAMSKLGAMNKTQATVQAIYQGLISL